MAQAPRQYKPPHATIGKTFQPKQRPTSRERGYGARWQKFRRWYFSFWFNRVCGCGCNQPATDLDHVEAVDGPHDERFYDPAAVIGLAHGCHSRKTSIADGAFGNRRTEEGQRLIETLKREAARRLALIEETEGLR